MKNFLQKNRKYFEKGGKFEKMYPLFEMVDTFIYTPGTVTEGRTHIRDGLDIKRTMIVVVLALIPCIIMALINTGYQANLAVQNMHELPLSGWRDTVIQWLGTGYIHGSTISNIVHGCLYFLPVYIVTMAIGGVWELIFSIIRGHEISEGFLVTSMLYPLILPPTIPLWQASLALSAGIVLGKEVFGGTGKNIVNPALIARAMLFFSYPASMTGDTIWVAADGYTKATPLGEASVSIVENLSLPGSMWDAFIGFIPGAMGETSTLACLIGAFILIITGIASWRIMISCVIGLTSVSLLFNMVGSDTNVMFSLSPIWHMVLGGFAFGTVFMATDPVSAAATEKGKYIYGFLIGALAVLIRVMNPGYPDGVMLAILFGNIFAPIIDYGVIKSNIKRRTMRYES